MPTSCTTTASANGTCCYGCSDKEKALFMVFDGHGKEGDLCALYCRDHLPNAVAKVRHSEAYLLICMIDMYSM
jgi:serine/threonine protein phosphatase PrpC